MVGCAFFVSPTWSDGKIRAKFGLFGVARVNSNVTEDRTTSMIKMCYYKEYFITQYILY